MLNIETIKLEFIEKAKILLEIDPYISINDLLAEYKVIPSIRLSRPTPDMIEDAGYKHDGKGEIIGKWGRMLKGSTNGKNRPTYYRVYNLRIDGFGSASNRPWSIAAHTLIFALTHRRWPMDGYVIDHIDDNPLNNHPDNLREVTNRNNNYSVKLAEKNIIIPTKMNGIDTHTNLLNFFN